MDFKGTDVVIFSDPIFNERHVRFTTLLSQTLSNQTCVRYCFNIHTPDSSRFPINISQSTKRKQPRRLIKNQTTYLNYFQKSQSNYPFSYRKTMIYPLNGKNYCFMDIVVKRACTLQLHDIKFTIPLKCLILLNEL